MSTQALFQNIGEFISESPEWVEKWFNLPVKAKYSLNVLFLPEILANVLNYLPLNNKYKGVSRLWYKEVRTAKKIRAEYLEKLSLKDFQQFYRNNHAWETQIHDELYRRHLLTVKKYWDVVAEYKKVVNEHFKAKVGTLEYRILSERFNKLGNEKREIFNDQVDIEYLIMSMFWTNADFHYQYQKHIMMQADGFDPYEVDLSKEFTNDYWDDEDPDEDVSDTPYEYDLSDSFI